MERKLGPVHITPEKFEKVALFLQLGLPSTLIRHENGALFLRLGLPSTLTRHENGAFREEFPKMLFKLKEFENSGRAFWYEQKFLRIRRHH